MPDKLSLYNGALSILAARKLATVTENREPRYKLDEIWERDARDRCLQMGQWNFAIRSIKPAIDASVTPAFGYTNAFLKPSDYVRLAGMCTDEFFREPLLNYTDEAGYWFAEEDVIYVRYVSNDTQYGFDYALWPYNFTKFVETFLAVEVAPRLTGLEYDSENLAKKFKKAKLEARNTDAMEQSVVFPPQSSWVRSRQGHSGGDRGKRGQLTG